MHNEQSNRGRQRLDIRRQAVSVALAVIPFGIAFGIASSDAGLTTWQASAFSTLVFAGSAQFAAVDILGDGGSVPAAVAAGLLLNLRCLAFGIVMAPGLRGPVWKRAAWSHLMIDETTAVGSARSDPHLRRYGYLWTGVAIFITWNISTLVGAATLPSTGDLVTDWGMDAAIPAVFLALLWPRLTRSDQRASALAGAVIAVALVPVTPPGIPILAAAVGVIAGWRTGPGPTTPVPPNPEDAR